MVYGDVSLAGLRLSLLHDCSFISTFLILRPIASDLPTLMWVAGHIGLGSPKQCYDASCFYAIKNE